MDRCGTTPSPSSAAAGAAGAKSRRFGRHYRKPCGGSKIGFGVEQGHLLRGRGSQNSERALWGQYLGNRGAGNQRHHQQWNIAPVSSHGNGTRRREERLEKRAVCRYIKAVPGDSCGALVSQCGISDRDFFKFNPKANLCATLMPGDYVCCSAGEPYTEPGPDGTCATHLIQNGDSCDALSKHYGVTVADLESGTRARLGLGQNARTCCLATTCALTTVIPCFLHPKQAGTQCGPLVPGTVLPSDRPISLADLNPCALKACPYLFGREICIPGLRMHFSESH